MPWRDQSIEEWEWDEVRQFCLQVGRSMVRDLDLAEDVAQEAALRAWRFRNRLKAAEGQAAWLRRIVHNEAVRLTQRHQSELLLDCPDEELHEGEAAKVEARLDVRSALGVLDAEERRLIALRYGADLTQASIAELLGTPEGTIKVRLHRARAKLKRAMDPHDP